MLTMQRVGVHRPYSTCLTSRAAQRNQHHTSVDMGVVVATVASTASSAPAKTAARSGTTLSLTVVDACARAVADSVSVESVLGGSAAAEAVGDKRSPGASGNEYLVLPIGECCKR